MAALVKMILMCAVIRLDLISLEIVILFNFLGKHPEVSIQVREKLRLEVISGYFLNKDMGDEKVGFS